jgi:hypothetical protein
VREVATSRVAAVDHLFVRIGSTKRTSLGRLPKSAFDPIGADTIVDKRWAAAHIFAW